MRSLKITHNITRRDQKSIDRYLNEIAKFEVLTPEEELNLFRRSKTGDEQAFYLLIQHNLRFVVSVAKQYQHLGFWLGDLINEGNIGLLKAARRFDETKGFKFISYAVWWIRQAIIQAINDKGRKVKVPLNISGATSKILAEKSEFLQREEREPTISELALATDLSEKQVRRCLESYQKCQSLDAPISDDDSGTSLVNMLKDTKGKQPDFNLAVEESRKIEIRELLQSLSPRQATIVELFFGIDKKSPMSLTDIGEILGVSRERVRQIKDKSLRKLRQRIRLHEAAY